MATISEAGAAEPTFDKVLDDVLAQARAALLAAHTCAISQSAGAYPEPCGTRAVEVPGPVADGERAAERLLCDHSHDLPPMPEGLPEVVAPTSPAQPTDGCLTLPLCRPTAMPKPASLVGLQAPASVPAAPEQEVPVACEAASSGTSHWVQEPVEVPIGPPSPELAKTVAPLPREDLVSYYRAGFLTTRTPRSDLSNIPTRELASRTFSAASTSWRGQSFLSPTAAVLGRKASSRRPKKLEAVMDAVRRAKGFQADQSGGGGWCCALHTRASEQIMRANLDLVMSLIILLNLVSIGVSVDFWPNWVGWIFIDAVFAFTFLLDMAVRLYSLGLRTYFCGDGRFLNTFECILVVFAFLEIGLAAFQAVSSSSDADSFIFAGLRAMRLARIARIVRVGRMSFFAELLLMLNGAIGGMRTFLWSQLLLLLPLYVIALVFRQTLGELAQDGVGAETFGSLSRAMFTMFRCLVAGECSTADGKPIFVLVTEAHGAGFGILYCFASVFMTFGLFNVIVAIYVESTVAAAKFNELRQKQNRLTDQKMFMEKAIQLIDFIWRHHEDNVDESNIYTTSVEDIQGIRITPDFFSCLRSRREFQDIMRELDIADEEQLDLFDTLDIDGGGTLDLEELIQGIAKLRGDARRSDIVSVGLMVRAMQGNVEEFQASAEHRLAEHAQLLHNLQAESSKAPQPPPARQARHCGQEGHASCAPQWRTICRHLGIHCGPTSFQLPIT